MGSFGIGLAAFIQEYRGRKLSRRLAELMFDNDVTDFTIGVRDMDGGSVRRISLAREDMPAVGALERERDLQRQRRIAAREDLQTEAVLVRGPRLESERLTSSVDPLSEEVELTGRIVTTHGGQFALFRTVDREYQIVSPRNLYETIPIGEDNHLRWNAEPLRAGQPIFLAGNPGTSQRLLTQAQLATVADVMLPLQQQVRSELRGRLIRFSQESEENAFWAAKELAGIENSYKRGRGRQLALIDPRFMGARAAAESDFRLRAAADAAVMPGGDPWQRIKAIQPDARRLFPSYFLLEAEEGGFSQLYKWARDLVRGAAERSRKSSDRLREFSDARLPRIEQSLFAERPVYPALDELQFGWWLAKIREILTVDDPRVAKLLGKESPEALASRVMRGTTLGDPAVRRRLWEGGEAAILASDDPLIVYVRSIDPVTRAARRAYEEMVSDPTDLASEDLARLRFSAFGTAMAPDATGTLRLSFGKVEGWTVDGRRVGHATTFGGLWARATGAVPFDLPPRLAAAQDRIPAGTLLNVAASTDTIGGSSGSPVVNERGEIVAANFDSTLLSQRSAYGYDRDINRSVLVSTAAITAVLRHAYGQQHLLEELGL